MAPSEDAPKAKREVRVKKLLTVCTSLVFLLGVSGGAKATFFPTFSDSTTLAVIQGTEFFSQSFDTNDVLGNTLADPSFVFEDIWIFEIVIPTTIKVISAASSTQFAGEHITSFRGEIYSGLFTDATPTVIADDSGSPIACVPGVDLCKITFPTLQLAAGDYFLRLLGTADGPGSPGADPNIFANYTGFITAVPLPPAAILFLSALAGLAGFSRIRRRKAVAT